jgi:electron transfer flavoprotein alpha subunit
LNKREKELKMSKTPEVVIFAEQFNGGLHRSALELCSLGQRLARELSGAASAIVIGQGSRKLASELILYGMDKVYVSEDPQFDHFQPEAYTAIIEQVSREASPEILLFGQTLHGRDLAPRLAFRLKAGLATDGVEFAIDPETKSLVVVRPTYGAKALATITFPMKPSIVTVRSKAVSPALKDEARTGEIIPLAIKLDPAKLRIKFIERIKQEAEGPKLEDAEVIVSGGRGLGRAENFALLQELAKLLGGVIGGSRVAIDNGWLPSTRQVGLTGTIVSPRLYIAVGISGASQHMAGCASSRCIVAINTDADAPIFRRAHYGVVGDYKPVITAMIQCTREG